MSRPRIENITRQCRRHSTHAASKSLVLSTLQKNDFPPKDALPDPSLKKSYFSPEIYAEAQPPPPSALSAFAHRIGLANILSNPSTVIQTCTHPSFHKYHPSAREFPPTPIKSSKIRAGRFQDMSHLRIDNSHLAALGNSLMGLFATEYVHATHPYLPTRVLKAAVSAYVGSLACSTVATEMGAASLLRWYRTPADAPAPPISHTEALASIPRALTGLICQKRSMTSARQFVHSYFLSRKIDLAGMLKFYDPKRALLEMVKKAGRERPRSRLLKETGRFSNTPVFVVGIFSGPDQLGEGFGSSLKMAEYRAAEDSLLRVYLTRTPEHLLQLPTSTFPIGVGTVFRPSIQAGAAEVSPERSSSQLTVEQTLSEGSYRPPNALGPAEIMQESGGKARISR